MEEELEREKLWRSKKIESYEEEVTEQRNIGRQSSRKRKYRKNLRSQELQTPGVKT